MHVVCLLFVLFHPITNPSALNNFIVCVLRSPRPTIIMAFLSHQMTFPMRPLNKEPEWSTTYDDLFNQYIDTDNLGFTDSAESPRERSDLDDFSSNIIKSVESSTSSCEPGSSPPHKWSVKDIEQDFWAKTLRSLEENAACLEQGQQLALSGDHLDYTLAPHPDFLSLGGCPSPQLSTPSSPSEAARRRKASWNNLRQSRPSPSPKSPGVKKSYHNGSKSPKMMSPSRYRAGFKDVWANKTKGTAQNYTLSLPLRSAPLSPPPSAKAIQTVDAAAVCSPREIDATPYYHPYSEQGLSPTSHSFQHHMGINTPNASPLTSPGVERGNFYGDMGTDTAQDAFHGRSMYYAIPPTAPQNNRLSWEAPDAEDDYELSPTFNPWVAASTIEQNVFHTDMETGYASLDQVAPVGPYHHHTATQELAQGGLMISYDPTLTVPDFPLETADTELSALPTNMYSMPRHEQHNQRLPSRTPSPTGAEQSPRSRWEPSKGRNRRTPSTPRSPRGVSKSGFVNFTPFDSAKLLNGVAPSGSSKTKARREKEAADKRRKFSQAAIKAVAEAGGDVQILEEVMM